MTDKIGCVIGSGYFAQNHLRAWQDLDGVTIAGVCDLDAELAQQGAGIVGGRAYCDAARMLEDERPDFVDIVTTHQSHRSLVELSAQAECHVICQKPMAFNYEDAQAMVQACDKAGVTFMIHENFRWQAPMQAVHSVVQSGRIGKPSYARIQHRHAHDIFSPQPYLRHEPRLAVMDVGVHLLDLARFFMGEVNSVYARNQTINPGISGEDSSVMCLGHAGDGVTLVDISFATKLHSDPFPETLVRIEGPLGTIELLPHFEMKVSGTDWSEVSKVCPVPTVWGSAERALIEESVAATQSHWLECLKENRQPQTSGRDNLRTLELAFQAYEEAAK